jgi:hypothetical protein
MNNKLYKHLSGILQAYQNCIKTNNKIWEDKHEQKLNELVKNEMPHGSGIDCGMELDLEKSNPNKLVFNFSFHFMDENGMYDGWIDYKLIVIPDLYNDFYTNITGRNKREIKDYLYEIFDYALRQEIDY